MIPLIGGCSLSRLSWTELSVFPKSQVFSVLSLQFFSLSSTKHQGYKLHLVVFVSAAHDHSTFLSPHSLDVRETLGEWKSVSQVLWQDSSLTARSFSLPYLNDEGRDETTSPQPPPPLLTSPSYKLDSLLPYNLDSPLSPLFSFSHQQPNHQLHHPRLSLNHLSVQNTP